MLSDGGYSGAGAGREADGRDTLRNDKRALGGERGRGQAEREDALRQRERERARLWGAAASAHARDRDDPAAGRGGARGNVRTAPHPDNARGARDYRGRRGRDARGGGGPELVRGGLRRLGFCGGARGVSTCCPRGEHQQVQAIGGGRRQGGEAAALLGGRQPAQGRLWGGGTEHEPGSRFRGGSRARASRVGG